MKIILLSTVRQTASCAGKNHVLQYRIRFCRLEPGYQSQCGLLLQKRDRPYRLQIVTIGKWFRKYGYQLGQYVQQRYRD